MSLASMYGATLDDRDAMEIDRAICDALGLPEYLTSRPYASEWIADIITVEERNGLCPKCGAYWQCDCERVDG